MRRYAIFMAVVTVVLYAGSSSAAMSARELERRIDEQSREIEQLKLEIEDIKKADGEGVTAGYRHGFFIRSADGDFELKFRFWTDLYYQYDGRTNAADSNTFGIRRARWLFTGNAFSPRLTYAIMPELTTAYQTTTSVYTTTNGDSVIINDRVDLNWRLLFLWAEYKFCDEFNVRFGEFVLPSERFYYRTNVIFMADLPLISTTEPFVAGFHLGLNLFGTIADKVRYDLYAVNGTGFDRLNINKSFLTGFKLMWYVMGKDDLSTADIDFSEKPVISTSINASYDKADGNVPARGRRGDNAFRFGGDFALKYRGFSFVPEFLYYWNETQHIKDWAAAVQTGYFLIPHRLELAAQASYIHFSGVDNNQQEYSAGINYYFFGQPVKIQADYSYLRFDVPGPDVIDHRIRVNLQMGFF